MFGRQVRSRMVDVRLDTLPQDLPWSKIDPRLVCKECGTAGSVNIVPNWHDRVASAIPFTKHWKGVYLVAEDFGKLGRAWREADYEATDLETVIEDLLSGQYNNPIRVVAFNTEERWSEDVSEDVAQELRRRCDLEARDVPSSIQDFVERHEGYAWRQLTLRLV